MRIEVKARLRGDRTGFVPIIELKSAVQAKAKNQTICILRNTKGTSITQSVTGEKYLILRLRRRLCHKQMKIIFIG